MGGLENKENKLETQDVCQKIYLYSVLATGFTDQLLRGGELRPVRKRFFPGGYSWEFFVRVCCPFLQILTAISDLKCHFAHPFSDLALKKLFLRYLD